MDFCWSISRQQTYVHGHGLLGLAILVQAKESNNRELVLEFDPVMGHRCVPQQMRFNIPDRRIVDSVRSALEAGWNPEKRGKQFVFQAGPVNPS